MMTNAMRRALVLVWRSKRFYVFMVVALALCTGINIAIFSVIDGTLLRALQVEDPSHVIVLSQFGPKGERLAFSYELFLSLQHADIAADLSASASVSNVPVRGLASLGDLGPVNVQLVSNNYFSVLGVSARPGRVFHTTDSADDIAIVSDNFKRTHFEGQSIIGQSLIVGKTPVTIIGIMPPTFHGDTPGQAVDVWLPMTIQPRIMQEDWLHSPWVSWGTNHRKTSIV